MARDDRDTRLERLDDLLERLLTILCQEGTEDTRYAQRTLAMMRRNIALAEGVLSPELLAFLREDYDSLFPPKGGLGEFYRRLEDAQEQRRRNEALQSLLGEMEDLLAAQPNKRI